MRVWEWSQRKRWRAKKHGRDCDERCARRSDPSERRRLPPAPRLPSPARSAPLQPLRLPLVARAPQPRADEPSRVERAKSNRSWSDDGDRHVRSSRAEQQREEHRPHAWISTRKRKRANEEDRVQLGRLLHAHAYRAQMPRRSGSCVACCRLLAVQKVTTRRSQSDVLQLEREAREGRQLR